ncbi:polysaccharide deacetylase family protein [Paenibacillus filicis]|uniref:Polysaccharide deacetylase family protein n=2 Tax=Paenibacillus filicis TaxID=669464 RepID=A0ABU9DPG8_9BACL
MKVCTILAALAIFSWLSGCTGRANERNEHLVPAMPSTPLSWLNPAQDLGQAGTVVPSGPVNNGFPGQASASPLEAFKPELTPDLAVSATGPAEEPAESASAVAETTSARDRLSDQQLQTPANSSAAPVSAETVSAAAYEKKAKLVSIPVLNYHSIGKKPGSTLVLDPELLAAQMDYLDREGYTPLTLSDFMLVLEHKLEKPDKPVLLTFDDGYMDNYELAMPILQRYNFPATLFMSPGSVGQPDYLTWEQAKEMKEAGWDIQPHGMTHPRLSKLSAAKQRLEITEASRLIEEELGVKSLVFCYPYGDFNNDTLAILKEEGFKYAFTIEQGLTTSRQHPLQLKRIYVNAQDSLKQWARKLGG